MRLRATAKINLSLEVLGRRPDGYHEVRSVLQAVDLADWVEIEEADALTLRVEPEGAAPAEENLVLRAAELLRGATGATRGAAITLRKQIPSGGRTGRRQQRRGCRAAGPWPAVGARPGPGAAWRSRRPPRQRRAVLPRGRNGARIGTRRAAGGAAGAGRTVRGHRDAHDGRGRAQDGSDVCAARLARPLRRLADRGDGAPNPRGRAGRRRAVQRIRRGGLLRHSVPTRRRARCSCRCIRGPYCSQGQGRRCSY